MKRLIVGISGASGAIYGVRLLQVLRDVTDIETHLVMSQAARQTLSLETDFSLREVQEKMGARKLTFASEEDLAELLRLAKGSVTPLGYMNDAAKKVKFVVDAEFRGKEIGVHPCDNTATVWLSADEMVSLIRKHGNFVYFLRF